jgi:hypothetical protein
MACSRQVGKDNGIACRVRVQGDRMRLGNVKLIFVILIIAEIKKTRSARAENSFRKIKDLQTGNGRAEDRWRCSEGVKRPILGPAMQIGIANPGHSMRSSLLLLAPLTSLLLLSGCVNDTASYQIDSNDHALTVLVMQDYFWSKQVNLRVIASRLPDCQRQFNLGKTPLADLNLELFSTGEETFLLRSGDEMWQVETQTCTELPPPSADVQAQPIGVFHLDAKKRLVFERAEGAVASTQ